MFWTEWKEKHKFWFQLWHVKSCHPYNRKSWTNPKSMTFLGLLREQRSKEKLLAVAVLGETLKAPWDSHSKKPQKLKVHKTPKSKKEEHSKKATQKCDSRRGKGRLIIVKYSSWGIYNKALPPKGWKDLIYLALSQMEKIIFPISAPTCLSVSPKHCGRGRWNYTSEDLVNIHSP